MQRNYIDNIKLQAVLETYNTENIDDVVNKVFNFTRKCGKCDKWIFIPLKYNMFLMSPLLRCFIIYLAVIYYKRARVDLFITNDYKYQIFYNFVRKYDKQKILLDTYRNILLKAKRTGKISPEEFQERINYNIRMFDGISETEKQRKYVLY